MLTMQPTTIPLTAITAPVMIEVDDLLQFISEDGSAHEAACNEEECFVLFAPLILYGPLVVEKVADVTFPSPALV